MARSLAMAAILLETLVSVGSEHSFAESGRASWYALTSRTASGERCNPSAMTAAHRSLPFGTIVRVKNLKNGKWILVRINDRGPFHHGRIIDVTKGAAATLGLIEDGTAQVQLTIISLKR